MKNNHILLIFLGVTAILFASCEKWLSVQPEDRYTEEQVYTTANGFEEALNGVYLSLSSNDLYGANLTLTIPDVLAQYYKTNTYSTHPFYSMGAYTYTEKNVKSQFSAIWTQAYVSIANINKLLENLDTKGESILKPARYKTMKGELLGLRAFIHFDLLRLYGPVYDSADSTALAIPYYHQVTSNIEPFLPANKVLESALTDLNNALPLLENDVVKALGYKEQNNHRFNYYAVLGTKARALLWRKDYIGAHQAAKKVIAVSSLFPWIVGSKITADLQNPDRIFHTELLFAVYANSLYDNYNKYFYYELANNILAGGSNQYINKVFESKAGDYRNTPIWKVPPQGVNFVVSQKYADIADKRAGVQQQRNLIPIIRLSEMYYILAETEADPTLALEYLNSVLNNRGLTSLAGNVDIQNEVLKEYRKEFYSEGQLWYYYKRRKITSILSALPSSNNGTIPNTAWVIPIPDEELANR